jgi:hypothetical protein
MGLSFLIAGNMCCGVRGEDLLVGLGPETAASALADPAARPFDMGRGPSPGWVLIGPGTADQDLTGWVQQALAVRHSPPCQVEAVAGLGPPGRGRRDVSGLSGRPVMSVGRTRAVPGGHPAWVSTPAVRPLPGCTARRRRLVTCRARPAQPPSPPRRRLGSGRACRLDRLVQCG